MEDEEHKEELMSDVDDDRKVEIISDGDWEVECKDAIFQVSEDAITAAGAQVLVERAAPPDDTSFTFYYDATSTRIFLNIIHHKSHSVPLDLGARELYGVGLIAAQAGCVSILGGYGRAWLYRAMEKRTSLNDIARFLLCADLYEQDDMYSDISQSLVCRNAEEFKKSEIESDDLNYGLPESVLDELESNRKLLALRTEIALMALLGKLNKCDHGTAQKFARTYFLTLVKLDIMPRKEGFRKKSYDQIRQIVAKFPPATYYPPGRCTAQGNCDICNRGSLEQSAYLTERLAGCIADDKLKLCRRCVNHLPCERHRRT